MPGVTAIPDVVDAPTIGSATAGLESATVTYTAAATGGTATSFTAISTPGSITGSSATSPITVSGLTGGTAYTFKVYGANASGTWSAVQSSASNSVTPTTTAFDSIATSSPSGVTSVTFSSLPSGYTSYQLRGHIIGSSAGATAYIAFNGDTGSSTLYSAHLLAGTGAAASSSNNTSVSSFTISDEYAGLNTTYATVFIVDIAQPQSTSINKTVRIINGLDVNGTGGGINLRSAARNSTDALTSLKVSLTSGNFSSGSTLALYGVL